MAEFAYKAASAGGGVVEGRIEARSREEAIRRLVDQGLTPVGVFDRAAPVAAAGAAPRTRRRWFTGGDRPSRAEILALTSELAVMLRAGLPLDGALPMRSRVERRCRGRWLRAATCSGRST